MDAPLLSAHPADPGDIIAGKYRVEGVLGTGGMGIVFAATHLHLERLVAVKVMRAELTEFPGAVERLVLEAKLAGQLRSEHVCKVLDVGTLPDGAPYVVMEYLEGSDLATRLQRDGVFATATAVDLILEACEALAEAHASHIVHRDLKPENLFVVPTLDGTSSIKVLDFGISKQRKGGVAASRNLTNPSSALGSPNYMPPEQMRSPRDVDARADLWAIGAILYEMLTGKQAFYGESVPEVCAAVMGATPISAAELRPDLPRALVQALERCLEKDPAARFPDVGELAAAIMPFGSPKAAISLARITRLLATAHAATLVTPSLAPRITPVGSRPPTLRASTSPLVELSSATMTTGAAVALLGTAPRRRRPLVLTTIAVVLVGTGAWAIHERAKSEAAEKTEGPATAALVALNPATPSAPTPASSASTAAAAETALAPSAASSGASIPEPGKPKATAPSRHVSRSRSPAPAAPTATATARAAAAVTGAWDTASFGPRR